MLSRLLTAVALTMLSAPALAQGPPAFTWTGFYVGANAGAKFSSRSGTIAAIPTFAFATFSTEADTSAQLASGRIPDKRGVVAGGGQIGYNLQIASNIVVGVEADIQAIGGRTGRAAPTISASPALFPNETISSTTTAPSNPGYVGTVRGRLGFLVMPELLVFATGGLAYGGSMERGTIVQRDDVSPPFPGCQFCSPYATSFGQTGMQTGYAAGGGVEWMIAPGWSVKAENIYYDLGSRSSVTTLSNLFSVAGLGPVGTPATTVLVRAKVRNDGDIFRLGLNYHLNLF